MKQILCIILIFWAVICSAGTLEEYQDIANKYEGNLSIIVERETFVIVYILDDKQELIAVEFRSYQAVPIMFFEKIDGVMACVWKHPDVEKMEMENLKRRGGIV